MRFAVCVGLTAVLARRAVTTFFVVVFDFVLLLRAMFAIGFSFVAFAVVDVLLGVYEFVVRDLDAV